MHGRRIDSAGNRALTTRAVVVGRLVGGFVVGIGLLSAVAGCSVGCTPTRIDLAPTPAITSLTSDVSLRGRLLGDGKPLVGIRVNFYVSVDEKTAEHIPAGTVDTDANGYATLGLPNGIKGVVLTTGRPTGIEAEFKTITDIDGTNYCNTTVRRGFGR